MSRQFSGSQRTIVVLLVMLAGVLLKLWLISAQTRSAFGAAADDDFHYLWLAANLAQGNWLGDFNHLTLNTGPGYPLWIALNSLHPAPLYLADHLLYAVACFVFVLALRPALGKVAAGALFLLLLYNPLSYEAQVRRYLRDSIYYSETLLVVSCLLGLLLRERAGFRQQVLWGSALGLALGGFWITKEEGLWLAPVVAAVLGWLAARSLLERGPRWRARLAVLLLPVLLAISTAAAVSVANYRHYGVFGVTEIHRAEFERALGALQRVRHERPLRYVPVSRDALEKIAGASETFRGLWPHFDIHGWSGAGRTSLGLLDDPRYEGEIPGGWFLWSLRHATARAGHYASGDQALRFYRRLADEIDDACANGRLDCGRSRSSLAPPWRRESLTPMLRALARGVGILSRLEGYHLAGWPSNGEPWRQQIFRDLTRDRLAPVAGAENGTSESGAPVLAAIARTYAVLVPVFAAAAVPTWLLGCLAAPLRRRSGLLLVGGVLLAAVASRLALLAYIDATSFHAMILRYLTPVYPLVLAFCGLMASALAGWVSARRRGSLVSRCES